MLLPDAISDHAIAAAEHGARDPQTGWPLLWCPLLTHYDDEGRIDAARMRRQLDFLTPAVGGFLVPGSTGDGWTLSPQQTLALLEAVVPMVVQRRAALLVGVLHGDAQAMREALARTVQWLCRRAGTDDLAEALRSASVQGFTFCAPHGAALSQQAIFADLDAVLATGVPASLYQLPQVTGNTVEPETVRALAARHPNLRMVKDTSGGDRIAEAGVDGLFLLRGAEGGYSRQLKCAGGRYDGFLLSTANGFGPQLAQLIAYLRDGRTAQADALSQRLEVVVGTVFAAAAQLPYGNAFTNANKAIDHFMAWGPRAPRAAGPRLHGGQRLPDALLATTGDALERHGLMPTHGYLHS